LLLARYSTAVLALVSFASDFSSVTELKSDAKDTMLARARMKAVGFLFSLSFNTMVLNKSLFNIFIGVNSHTLVLATLLNSVYMKVNMLTDTNKKGVFQFPLRGG